MVKITTLAGGIGLNRGSFGGGFGHGEHLVAETCAVFSGASTLTGAGVDWVVVNVGSDADAFVGKTISRMSFRLDCLDCSTAWEFDDSPAFMSADASVDAGSASLVAFRPSSR